jgi:hypothetical protein
MIEINTDDAVIKNETLSAKEIVLLANLLQSKKITDVLIINCSFDTEGKKGAALVRLCQGI